MQVGFGLSPFRSGLVTFASAVGAMGMKTLAARIIRTFGFRNIMTINAVVSSVFLAACALFTPATPLLLIMILLVVGGFFRSLQFTAINTVAYAEVEPAQMSRATTLVSVNQQLAISAGVAVGAASVEPPCCCTTSARLSAADFCARVHRVSRDHLGDLRPISSIRMPDDAGHRVSGGARGRESLPRVAEGRGESRAPPKTHRAISGWVNEVIDCSVVARAPSQCRMSRFRNLLMRCAAVRLRIARLLRRLRSRNAGSSARRETPSPARNARTNPSGSMPA